VGKPEGKSRRGRHKRRLEDNIKLDLIDVVRRGMDSLVLDRDS
jgi:hypothetical protein